MAHKEGSLGLGSTGSISNAIAAKSNITVKFYAIIMIVTVKKKRVFKDAVLKNMKNGFKNKTRSDSIVVKKFGQVLPKN